MYKQIALSFYFSMIFAATFFSCKNDGATSATGAAAGKAAETTSKAAQEAPPTGPRPSDAYETAVSYSAGKFKTASGKEVAVPMFGDPKAITFYIVRHAEKQSEGDNPELTLAGQQRASRLGMVLKGARVDYIASTNAKRTLETGKLLYQHIGSPPFQSYPPDMMQAWFTDIMDMGTGRGYVVVGHTNTIPTLTGWLGIKEPITIDENDYANLIVISTKAGKGEMVRLRYD